MPGKGWCPQGLFSTLRTPQGQQVISANAKGPRDATSHPIDHIALHTATDLDDQCIHQMRLILTALCYTDRQLPAFSTYVHWFDLLEIRNKSTTNQTSGVWALVYSMTSMYHYRCDKQRSAIQTLLLNAVKYGHKIFQSPELCVQKSVTWALPCPFWHYLSSIC